MMRQQQFRGGIQATQPAATIGFSTGSPSSVVAAAAAVPVVSLRSSSHQEALTRKQASPSLQSPPKVLTVQSLLANLLLEYSSYDRLKIVKSQGNFCYENSTFKSCTDRSALKFQANVLRLVDILSTKKSTPKYVDDSRIQIIKMLNKTATLLVQNEDYEKSFRILDYAARISFEKQKGEEQSQISHDGKEWNNYCASEFNSSEAVECAIQFSVTLNNIAVICFQQQNRATLSKRYLKTALTFTSSFRKQQKGRLRTVYEEEFDRIEAISLCSLCRIYRAEEKYETVQKYSKQLLHILEGKVFSRFSESERSELMNDTKFLSDLQVVLQGYIYQGWSLNPLKNSLIETQFSTADAPHSLISHRISIYRNGFKLSKIFLSSINPSLMQFFSSVLESDQQQLQQLQCKHQRELQQPLEDHKNSLQQEKNKQNHSSESRAYGIKAFIIKSQYREEILPSAPLIVDDQEDDNNPNIVSDEFDEERETKLSVKQDDDTSVKKRLEIFTGKLELNKLASAHKHNNPARRTIRPQNSHSRQQSSDLIDSPLDIHVKKSKGISIPSQQKSTAAAPTSQISQQSPNSKSNNYNKNNDPFSVFNRNIELESNSSRSSSSIGKRIGGNTSFEEIQPKLRQVESVNVSQQDLKEKKSSNPFLIQMKQPQPVASKFCSSRENSFLLNNNNNNNNQMCSNSARLHELQRQQSSLLFSQLQQQQQHQIETMKQQNQHLQLQLQIQQQQMLNTTIELARMQSNSTNPQAVPPPGSQSNIFQNNLFTSNAVNGSTSTSAVAAAAAAAAATVVMNSILVHSNSNNSVRGSDRNIIMDVRNLMEDTIKTTDTLPTESPLKLQMTSDQQDLLKYAIKKQHKNSLQKTVNSTLSPQKISLIQSDENEDSNKQNTQFPFDHPLPASNRPLQPSNFTPHSSLNNPTTNLPSPVSTQNNQTPTSPTTREHHSIQKQTQNPQITSTETITEEAKSGEKAPPLSKFEMNLKTALYEQQRMSLRSRQIGTFQVDCNDGNSSRDNNESLSNNTTNNQFNSHANSDNNTIENKQKPTLIPQNQIEESQSQQQQDQSQKLDNQQEKILQEYYTSTSIPYSASDPPQLGSVYQNNMNIQNQPFQNVAFTSNNNNNHNNHPKPTAQVLQKKDTLQAFQQNFQSSKQNPSQASFPIVSLNALQDNLYQAASRRSLGPRSNITSQIIYDQMGNACQQSISSSAAAAAAAANSKVTSSSSIPSSNKVAIRNQGTPEITPPNSPHKHSRLSPPPPPLHLKRKPKNFNQNSEQKYYSPQIGPSANTPFGVTRSSNSSTHIRRSMQFSSSLAPQNSSSHFIPLPPLLLDSVHTSSKSINSRRSSEVMYYRDGLVSSNYHSSQNYSIPRQNYLNHITPEFLSQSLNSKVIKRIQFAGKIREVQIKLLKLNNSDEILFDISAVSTDRSNQSIVAREQLTLRVLLGVLSYLELCLPFSKPLKTIGGFEDICEFLIFPFMRLNSNGSSNSNTDTNEGTNCNKIELVQDYHTLHINEENENVLVMVLFMKALCTVTFSHLTRNQFLILVKIHDMELVRVDVELDEATMKIHFDSLYDDDQSGSIDTNLFDSIQKRQADLIANLFQQNEELNDQDFEDQFKNWNQIGIRVKESIAEFKTQKNESVLKLAAFKVKNIPALTEKVQQILVNLEKILIETHELQTFEDIVQVKAKQQCIVLRAKVSDDFNKGSIYVVTEVDREKVPRMFMLSLSNLHETHAPLGLTVRAQGHKKIEGVEFNKHFGVSLEKLDSDDLFYFLTLLAIKHDLYTFQKALEEDDYDRYNSNPIIIKQTSVGGYSRTFIGEMYKNPVTIELIGVDDIPFGLRVILDVDGNEDGVFLAIDATDWTKVIPIVAGAKKKRSKKYNDEFGIIKNYSLTTVLDSIGYDMVLDSLVFSAVRARVAKVLRAGLQSSLDRIDNVLNYFSVLQFLENKFIL